MNENKYNDDYFASRQGNDIRRQQQFALDEKFIRKYLQMGLFVMLVVQLASLLGL